MFGAPLSRGPWDTQGKDTYSPRLQALLFPDRPCLVPISPDTQKFQLQAPGALPEMSADNTRASDVSMSEHTPVKSAISKQASWHSQSMHSTPYPLFSRRPALSTWPAKTTSSFRVSQGDSESDSGEEAHASSASFVVRAPLDLSGELHCAAACISVQI